MDFSSLHIFMLYAMHNIQYPLDRDPYMQIVPDAPKEIRQYIKFVVLALVNAASEGKAKSAWSHQLKTDYATMYPLYEEHIKAKGLTIRDLPELCRAAFPEIADEFFSGRGLEVQNRDSRIAVDVCLHFARSGRACLPIHDSFIVKACYRDELGRVMRDVYGAHMGFEINVK